MKLLAIHFGFHDSNACYFDGNLVHYHKFERTEGFKRYYFGNYWSWKYKIEKLWNININDIDEIAIWFEPLEYNSILLNNNNSKVVNQIVPEFNFYKNQIIWVPHHYAHYLSHWIMIDKKIDIAFSIDGSGDTKSWCIYQDDQLIKSGIVEFGSIGNSLTEVADWIGIKSQCEVDQAGKLMGLQSYGNFDKNYYNLIKNYNFFNNLGNIYNIDRWINYCGSIEKAHERQNDFAKTIHIHTEKILIELFTKYANKNDTIFYSGGVAQNILWNTELKKIFPNLIIPPYAGDDGISLGLIEYLRKKNNLPKLKINNFPYCQSDISPNEDIKDETINRAAELLSQGYTLGWYQGYGEIGPRALGNRSILFDPRIPNGKDIINKIKKREYYRPFGASVLEEYANKYFEYPYDEYMLYASKVLTNIFPSITHVDGTCRIQIVNNNNIIYQKLLNKFNEITGCPVLLNTSLNLAGKGICGYPEEAFEIFFHTELDAIVVGNKILTKR